MNFKKIIIIGSIILGISNTAESAPEYWKPSQSLRNRCNLFQSSATAAELGKKNGASLDFMLNRVDISQEDEVVKGIMREGVLAAYDGKNSDNNYYQECLNSHQDEDIAKQDSINKIKGQWMCQAEGSSNETQIWLTYRENSYYSVASYKNQNWLHGLFTIDGDFIIEHLGGNPQLETKRKFSHDANGVLSIQGLPCHTFNSDETRPGWKRPVQKPN